MSYLLGPNSNDHLNFNERIIYVRFKYYKYGSGVLGEKVVLFCPMKMKLHVGRDS